VRPLFIKGGRIIDSSRGWDEIGSLLIREGMISWFGKGGVALPQAGCDIINAAGLVICPGFIDMHCHLRQPGFEDKETIATGTEAAARGGFTTVCCIPNTNPPLDSRDTIDYVKTVAAQEGLIRVLPIGCVSKGRLGQELVDMAELASAGVVGYSDDGEPVANSRLMRQALEYSCTSGLPVIDHCEDKSLTVDGQINEGVMSNRLGLAGMPAAAEEIILARDLALAQLTGGWLHVAHVSTAGSVDLIRRAKDKGVMVTAEVTPHHLTMTEEMVAGYDTSAKVNPPLRTKRDVKALIQGLKAGVIDVIATDHAPYTESEKSGEFALAPFGISGLETALGSLMKLMHAGELPLTDIIHRLTAAPARILNDKGLGELEVGSVADVTIFDPDREWLVDTGLFASKGKNTPLAGSVLRGKVMATISQGKLVYQDDTLKIETVRGN